MPDRNERDFRAAMERLTRQVSSSEPESVRTTYLAVPQEGTAYLAGSAVQPLGQLVERPSGLLIPAAAARRPEPLDLTTVYMTVTEVMGFDPGLDWALRAFGDIPFNFVVGFTTSLLAAWQSLTADKRDLDRQLIERSFTNEARLRAMNLQRSGRVLLAPQVLMIMTKLALFRAAPDAPQPTPQTSLLPVILLTIAEHLGDGGDISESDEEGSRRLAREIIANQHFNAPADPAQLTARFARRWFELPTERHADPLVMDVAELYKEATGIDLRDLAVVSLALCGGANEGRTLSDMGYLDKLRWERERIERILSLLSRTRDEFATLVREEEEEFGYGATDWAFSTFERFPLLRTGDQIQVLNSQMLMARVFGWLPFFDIQSALPGRANRAARGRFEGAFRHLTELYAREVIDCIAPSMSGGVARVFHEEELKSAYESPGVRIADCAVLYPAGWVVIEISTRRLTRPSAVAYSEAALDRDLESLVAEAEQIYSLIDQIRTNEQLLTGSQPSPGRRFYPVLTLTEGFPINPIVTTRVRDALTARGRGTLPDTAPLAIVELTTLELVEATQEQGGPSLPDILEGHQRSGLANASLRDYMVVDAGLNASRSRRIDRLFVLPFEWAASALAEIDAEHDSD
jgi:hypothetical protein